MDITKIIDQNSTHIDILKLRDHDIIRGTIKIGDKYIILRTYRYSNGYILNYKDDAHLFEVSAEHYYIREAFKHLKIPYSKASLTQLYDYFIKNTVKFLRENADDKKTN